MNLKDIIKKLKLKRWIGNEKYSDPNHPPNPKKQKNYFEYDWYFYKEKKNDC